MRAQPIRPSDCVARVSLQGNFELSDRFELRYLRNVHTRLPRGAATFHRISRQHVRLEIQRHRKAEDHLGERSELAGTDLRCALLLLFCVLRGFRLSNFPESRWSTGRNSVVQCRCCGILIAPRRRSSCRMREANIQYDSAILIARLMRVSFERGSKVSARNPGQALLERKVENLGLRREVEDEIARISTEQKVQVKRYILTGTPGCGKTSDHSLLGGRRLRRRRGSCDRHHRAATGAGYR